MTTKAILRNFLSVCALVLGTSFWVSGQNYSVAPLKDFLQPNKDKHRIILKAIEDRTDLTIAQKLVLYESEMSKLKEAFRTARKTEYQSKEVTLSVEKSCTSASSGGVKDCGYGTVNAPNSDMYTRTDWIKVIGTNKGTTVAPDGSSAGLKMTVAGKGRNFGTLYATFRYKPESISTLVDKETVDLFNQVVL
ncbi:hypothetical protein [Desertivirga arenae]|uniref:hypothetical protein n=1 Tax=Desertivirga arenae TaxID=2810309 RepID=UPI001A978C8A|nr:hypothetical protein [Pedobacter sp. SYSU D00823]